MSTSAQWFIWATLWTLFGAAEFAKDYRHVKRYGWYGWAFSSTAYWAIVAAFAMFCGVMT